MPWEWSFRTWWGSKDHLGLEAEVPFPKYAEVRSSSTQAVCGLSAGEVETVESRLSPPAYGIAPTVPGHLHRPILSGSGHPGWVQICPDGGGFVYEVDGVLAGEDKVPSRNSVPAVQILVSYPWSAHPYSLGSG